MAEASINTVHRACGDTVSARSAQSEPEHVAGGTFEACDGRTLRIAWYITVYHSAEASSFSCADRLAAGRQAF